MSIEIIGSNGKSINLITKKILENKIDNIIFEYNILKEKYNNLKDHEEKIDFIFENIISKQIKDFNILENKNEEQTEEV